MLYEYVQEAGVRRLALVGLAKHAGKTTALNRIVKEASAAGVRLSLQSMGVDGERFDALIGVEKPAVHAPAGTLIATAAGALGQATARLEWLEATGVPSALGEICIARVAEAGSVLLAGVRQVEQAERMLVRLAKWGAQLQLIDGAFDRMASATPDLADGVVLCTGASVGRSITDVVRETEAALTRLQLPPVQQDWERDLAALARGKGRAIAGGPAVRPQVLAGTNPFLLRPSPASGWPEDASAIAVPGVVTDRLLAQWEGGVQTVILKDGTRWLGSLAGWRRFVGKGGRLLVERPIRIVAITVNAVSPEGYRVPRRELLEAIRLTVGGLPVVDCLGAGC